MTSIELLSGEVSFFLAQGYHIFLVDNHNTLTHRLSSLVRIQTSKELRSVDPTFNPRDFQVSWAYIHVMGIYSCVSGGRARWVAPREHGKRLKIMRGS